MILSAELQPTALLYFVSQRAHGFRSDFDAFGNRGLRGVDGGENLCAAAFPLDPKRQRRLRRVFSTLKPAALDGLSDKLLLLGSEVYLHGANIIG